MLLSFACCEDCDPCKTGATYACDTWTPINFLKQRANGNPAVGVLGHGNLKGKPVEGSFFGQSSFARHALVKESSCVVVPKGTDVKTLAPLGCGLQTGAGGVFHAANVQPHNTVLVSGLGGVGMAALFAAASIGAKTIIVVDINEERLKLVCPVFWARRRRLILPGERARGYPCGQHKVSFWNNDARGSPPTHRRAWRRLCYRVHRTPGSSQGRLFGAWDARSYGADWLFSRRAQRRRKSPLSPYMGRSLTTSVQRHPARSPQH